MKHIVKFSTYSIILTCICIVILGGVAINQINRGFHTHTYFLLAAMATILIFGLIYSPLAISVDDSSLTVHRAIKKKRIPLNEIDDVRLVSPTMSEKRICGSGGCFGYWGWMKEPTLGQYFAYYGKASDCFLVQLKNGRKYLLGCENPGEIVSDLKQRISK